MISRQLFHWDVPLQDERGRTKTFRLSAYWSPAFEGVRETVAQAAAVMATVKEGVQHHAVGIPMPVVA